MKIRSLLFLVALVASFFATAPAQAEYRWSHQRRYHRPPPPPPQRQQLPPIVQQFGNQVLGRFFGPGQRRQMQQQDCGPVYRPQPRVYHQQRWCEPRQQVRYGHRKVAKKPCRQAVSKPCKRQIIGREVCRPMIEYISRGDTPKMYDGGDFGPKEPKAPKPPKPPKQQGGDGKTFKK